MIYSGASERLVLPLKRTSKRKTRPAVLSQTGINILIIRLIIALSVFSALLSLSLFKRFAFSLDSRLIMSRNLF